MADDHFENLAAKALLGEATSEEKTELEALLARDPRLREEYAQLKVAHDMMREFGPLLRAMNAPPVPVPPERLRQLQEAVREAREALMAEERTAAVTPDTAPSPIIVPARGWFSAHLWETALAAAAVLLAMFLINRAYHSGTGAKSEITLAQQPNPAPSLDTAAGVSNLLSLPLPRFLASISLAGPAATTRSITPVAVYSPAGPTRSTQPIIVWQADPGKKYDLSIIDDTDPAIPPWRVNAVVPPLEFAKVEAWKARPLQPGGLYKLRLHESGQPVSPAQTTEAPFRVLADATPAQARTPEEKIAHAHRLLTIEPICFGDALAELLPLEPGTADTEAVLKMEGLIFLKLGFAAEYGAAIERLKTLGPRP